MSSFQVDGTWTTPKKTTVKGINIGCTNDNFVALTPQDVTINPMNFNHEFENNAITIQGLATPYSKKSTSHNSVMNSCPQFTQGLENNGNNGHVKKSQHVSKYTTPNKANKANLLDSSNNHKLHPTKRSQSVINASKKLGIDMFTQKLSPMQASQCHNLFSAKDEIIEQKDIIMQKQKQIIVQLRQTNMELEDLLMQKQQEIQLQSTNERFTLHLQEYQYQIEQLKQQLVEAKHFKQREIEKLQKKLGEKEYENGNMEIALKEMEIASSTDSGKLQAQLDAKISELSVEQEKTQNLLNELKKTSQEKNKLQNYLEELPTADEFKELQHQVKKLELELTTNQEKHEILQKRYKEKKNENHKLDDQNEKLQETNSDLQQEIDRINKILEKYRTRDKLGPVLLEEYEALKEKITEFQQEKENLKQSLEKRHKKMKLLHYEMINKQKEYEEEKSKQDDIIISLKNELQQKAVSVTQINARSQELLEKSLDLQAELKKYKETYTDEHRTKIKDLFTQEKGTSQDVNVKNQISQCSEDVKSLAMLCSSRLKGNDPSLHALLGLRDSPDKTHAGFPPGGSGSGENSINDINVDTVSNNIELIQQMRSDIEELRHVVSEQYAQELGDNMCVTQ